MGKQEFVQTCCFHFFLIIIAIKKSDKNLPLGNIYRQTDRQKESRTDRKTDRQTNRQTNECTKKEPLSVVPKISLAWGQ